MANLGGDFVGPVTLTVILTEDVEGITTVHSETFVAVVLSGGVFSVVLGTEAPLDVDMLAQADSLFVQVEVNGTLVAAPSAIAPVAQAFRAGMAERTEGVRAMPAAPSECTVAAVGQVYINTGDGQLYVCSNGSDWEPVKGIPGEKGDKGEVGETGAQGPKGDPKTSVDGLAGGTISGDVVIDGTLQVKNQQLGFATDPLVLFGRTPNGCTSSNSNYFGWVELPTHFDVDPVILVSNDESLNNNGATWERLTRLRRNRFGVRCDAVSDALHWMAIEPGIHTIDGKTVMAGVQPTVKNGDSIFFPDNFDSPPVVLVFIDETGDDNGSTEIRIRGEVGNSGFQLTVNGSSGADNVHWVALEPGTYKHGRYTFEAGVFENLNACSNPCTWSWPTPWPRAPGVVHTITDTNNSGGSTWIRHFDVTRTLYQARLSGGGTEKVQWVAFIRD